MKQGLVLDKCFLDGVGKSRLHELSETYQLIVSGPLFYELLTAQPKSRIRCFSKFPQQTNPAILVDHIGTLLRKEIVRQLPSGPPSANRINIDFEFNEKLLDSSYELPLQAARSLEHQGLELNSELYQIIELSKMSEELFGPLLVGSQEDQDRARLEAEQLIANCEAVIDFFGQLESPDPALPYPPKHKVTANWAFIRWLQAKMLFALDIHLRYRGGIDEQLSAGVLERLEHDLHDMQHLTLGVLEGAFATNERKLQRWWRLVMPNGQLISTNVA